MMHMPRKTALLDYSLCRPSECDGGGICRLVEVCPSHLIKQEEPGLPPMTEPFSCRACGECVLACPLNAIKIVSM
jgi:NAD-dependent dihydropyrimidine dehydrogenase PreA subunit